VRVTLHPPPSPGPVVGIPGRRPTVLDASRSALIPLRPLTVGEILDAGFTVLRTNVRAMMGLPLAVAGIAGAYVLGLTALAYGLGNTSGELAQGLLLGLGGLLGVLLLAMCVAWMTAVLTRASLHTVLGDGFAPDSRISWREARAMFWPMVGLSLLTGVAATVVNSVTSVIYYLALIPMLVTGADSPAGIVLSTALSALVGLALYSVTYSYISLAVPAWTVENAAMPGWIGKPARRTNIVTTFGRSIVLIGLRNLPRAAAVLAAVATIAVLVAGVVYLGVLLVLVLYSDVVGLDMSMVLESPWILGALYAVVLVLVSSALVAFVASVQTVLYLDLRMRREGLDLAMRFDEVDVPQPSAPPVQWVAPMPWTPPPVRWMPPVDGRRP